ncbi:uncharacterized protein LOC127254394 [Andrographis paniculata]|uniref:uncharacterized protein LOC127254394 n=1 Tax=Andrographis paniculata TaxID=175694 RepID=UPI0021E90C60|nr:uncharacterized protein LOC127254394 [Andrographis paniculata]
MAYHSMAKSRSLEIMIESAGQMGPGVKGPSYHELGVPLLEKTVKNTQTLKEKHVIAWKQYGCSLMADGWTDKRGRDLINFLINSPEDTFFFKSIDASSQAQVASLLADLLQEKIEEIGKEYVVQVVIDNSANFKAAAHCLDLMLEDIGKLSVFRAKIYNARRSLYKHRDALRSLFLSEYWTTSKLTNTNAGRLVANMVLSSPFWTGVEYCIKASHPLLIILRIVDKDEKPTMPELAVPMNEAKRKIK